MDELFARSSDILIVWTDVTDQQRLPVFQETIQMKAKEAFLTVESMDQLFECE